MILAGGAMAYALVGSLNAFFGTGYGRMLMVKLAAVAALLGLAALNKLRFVPALERGDTSAGDKLARSIAWEWGAVLLILLATALLTTSLTMPM
jgi:putative copper resistance protein D